MRVILVLCLFAATLGLPASARAQQPAQKPDAPKPWWERLTFYGDLRGRYESFYQGGTEARHRHRFRLRVGFRAAILEGLDFNLRLAGGDPGDPTSTNQSMTDFLTRKPLNIDQVSLAWTPPEAKTVTLAIGKFAYPVTRTQLVWDDDVNWEGAYQQLAPASPGPVTLRIVTVQSPISEVRADDDAFMFGEQGQIGFKAGRHSVQLSVADYYFKEADLIAVGLDTRVLRSQSTNALRRDGAGRVIGYVSGFNLVDTIAEVTFDTGRAQYPLSALADVVINTKAATDEDLGYWLVANYGRATSPKTWSANYTFARIERDAVVSAFNFDDIVSATNCWLNMITVSYAPRTRVNLDVRALLSKLIDAPANNPNRLVKRIQIDARVAF